MKKTISAVLLLFAAGILTIALTGFNTPTKSKKQSLVVERQQWKIQHMRGNIPSEEFDIGLTVDVPVGGNPVLIDSVTCLLNEAFYRFFEDRMDPRFTSDELYCKDGRRLVQHYQEAYKPYIEDTCEFHGGCPTFDYLCVALVEQTNTFVTYEVSCYFIGEGDCEYLNWVTFDKIDGHRLPKVIEDDQVIPLLRHTSGTDYDVMDDVGYRLSMGFDAAWRCEFGLTRDTLRCQYLYAPGIVETFNLGMETAKPYLSEEALKLL